MLKLPHNCISHARKIMLKILQARLQQDMTVKFQMFKLDLEKTEESDIKLPTFDGSSKKQEFQKSNYFCFIDYAKAFDCVDHNKLKNSSRDGNTKLPNLPSEKSVCRSKSNSYNWTWKNRLVPNQERSMSRLYIVTLLI